MKKKLVIFYIVYFGCSFPMEMTTEKPIEIEQEEIKQPSVKPEGVSLKYLSEPQRIINRATGLQEIQRMQTGVINIEAMEPLAGATFQELIEERDLDNYNFIVAKIETEVNGVPAIDYFDAYLLLQHVYGPKFIRPRDSAHMPVNRFANLYSTYNLLFSKVIAADNFNLKHPITKAPILGLIKLYELVGSEDEAFTYIGSDYDLHALMPENTVHSLLAHKMNANNPVSDDKSIQLQSINQLADQYTNKYMSNFHQSDFNQAVRYLSNAIRFNDNENKKILFKFDLGTIYFLHSTSKPELTNIAIEYLNEIIHQAIDPLLRTQAAAMVARLHVQTTKDYAKARDLLTIVENETTSPLAKANALLLKGVMYLEGYGEKVDLDKAENYFVAAVNIAPSNKRVSEEAYAGLKKIKRLRDSDQPAKKIRIE